MRKVGNLLFITQGLLVSGAGLQRPFCPRPPVLVIFGRQVSVSSCISRMSLKKSLSEWSFAPSQLAARLPLDPDTENQVRRNVPGAVFSEGMVKHKACSEKRPKTKSFPVIVIVQNLV